MIVFDLRCGDGHVFESWFASSSAYETQRERALVSCPVCGNSSVSKAVMAPNVAAKGNRSTGPARDIDPTIDKAAITALAAIQAAMLENSEWVGRGFPDRARAMHLGEEVAAPIHGETSIAEARELIEEGVPIAPLPLPVIAPNARN